MGWLPDLKLRRVGSGGLFQSLSFKIAFPEGKIEIHDHEKDLNL